MISQSELRERYKYDPITGEFLFLIDIHKMRVGDRAGTLSKQGYVKISIGGKIHCAHRLAFLYMTGNLPKKDVDHRNGVRNDNRWANLRECSRRLNVGNTKPSTRNTSGIKGVSFCAGRKKWRACVHSKGKQVASRYFTNKKDAGAFYKDKVNKIYGEFCHHNRETVL